MRNVLDSDNANGGFLLGRRSWNLLLRPSTIHSIDSPAGRPPARHVLLLASCFFQVFWPFKSASAIIRRMLTNPIQSNPAQSTTTPAGHAEPPAYRPPASPPRRPTRRNRQRRGPQLPRGRRRGLPPGGPGGGPPSSSGDAGQTMPPLCAMGSTTAVIGCGPAIHQRRRRRFLGPILVNPIAGVERPVFARRRRGGSEQGRRYSVRLRPSRAIRGQNVGYEGLVAQLGRRRCWRR